MGKHDNRRSMKMRRRKGQQKLKARIKRRKAQRPSAKGGTASATTRAPAKKKPVKE
jgi:hypothetical protein